MKDDASTPEWKYLMFFFLYNGANYTIHTTSDVTLLCKWISISVWHCTKETDLENHPRKHFIYIVLSAKVESQKSDYSEQIRPTLMCLTQPYLAHNCQFSGVESLIPTLINLSCFNKWVLFSDDTLHLTDEGFFVCFRVLGCTELSMMGDQDAGWC